MVLCLQARPLEMTTLSFMPYGVTRYSTSRNPVRVSVPSWYVLAGTKHLSPCLVCRVSFLFFLLYLKSPDKFSV